MSDRPPIDLSRYNRPGQSRLRYLNGNAATYLEALRAELTAKFPGTAQDPGPYHDEEAVTGEPVAERIERLRKQYDAPRRPMLDWGWEIARALARAGHILGEHVDAYANEGFLRTALLPESLRRLAALIDYVPAPPASAEVLIALEAKDGLEGTVARGLQLSGSPATGGASVVFETLSDIYVDEKLNCLQHRDRNSNPARLSENKKRLELDQRIDGLLPGDPIILVNSVDGKVQWEAQLIQSIKQDAQTKKTVLELTQEVTLGGEVGKAQVLLKPRVRFTLDRDPPLKNPPEPYPLTFRLKPTEKLYLSPVERSLQNQKCVVSDGQNVGWAECTVAFEQEEETKKAKPTLAPAPAPKDTNWTVKPDLDFTRLLTVIYADFSMEAKLDGWDKNVTSLKDQKEIPLELRELPSALVPGKRVLVHSSDTLVSLENRIERVNAAERRITLVDALPDSLNVWSLRINANVVQAGHGETRPDKILGSGDATKARQRFVLQESNPGVAFISDPRMPHGVRADVTVRVDDIIYREVSRLEDCGAGDCVFTTRISDEGFLLFEFGDGRSGRRLPTGRDNVRVSYRKGSGTVGNVVAGTLKLAHAHALVKEGRQPFDASGGSDGQDLESIRNHAPARLQALDRAVSISDFAALAQSHSKVWHARAVPGPAAGVSRSVSLRSAGRPVTVYVVPAGDTDLSDSLKDALESFLNHKTMPGVVALVEKYQPVRLQLHIAVEVKAATHDPQQVTQQVRAVLLHAFSVRQRRLGQAVYLSEVYKLVEAVPGVVASRCAFASGSEQVQPALPHQVLCWDLNQPGLSVLSAEYAS